jgi:serine/threonine-protein kinase
VLDFGLAKLTLTEESRDGASAVLTHSPTLTFQATQVGVLMGTAAYMSPEQAKGRAVDKRSDVWAFGCVLFEMLTGRPAFAGEDISDTLASILKSEPDWRLLREDVPPAVQTLLKRCLAKDVRKRVADLAAAQFVISDIADLPSSSATHVVRDPQPSLTQRKTALIVAAAVFGTALLVGSLAWVVLTPRASSSPLVRFSLTLSQDRQFSVAGRQLLTLSPDGTQLAYVSGNLLMLRSMSEVEFRPVPGIGDENQALHTPTFSPDGRSLAFFSGGFVKRIAVTGGAPVTVCAAGPPLGMTWDQTGIVVGQGVRGVIRCSPNGGDPEQLATVRADELAHGPQLLPGGSALLFTIARATGGPTRWDQAQIVVQQLPSGERKTLLNGGSDGRYVSSGHLLYALGGVVFAVPFDVRRLEVTGSAAAVLNGVRRARGLASGNTMLDTSNSGTLVYVPGPTGLITNQRTIGIADRSGMVTPLKLPRGPYAHVRAARDGQRVAIGTDDGKDAIIWIYDLAETTALRRLTLEGENRFPVWAPDNRRIAFQSSRQGDLAIFAQSADGTGEIERLTKPADGDAHVPESWSPDGRHLLFSVVREASYSLWALSLVDKKTTPVGTVKSAEPIGAVFSPDGRWIAYASSPTWTVGGLNANRGIYIQQFPSGEPYQVPKQQIDFHPVWTPSGRELVFVPTGASGRMAAVTVTRQSDLSFSAASTFPARVTADRLSGESRAYDILSDGRFIGPLSEDARGAEMDASAGEIHVVLNWTEELKSRVPVN